MDERELASSAVNDIFALLDEVRAIARTGLHYCDDPFDRARYERLLDMAASRSSSG